MRLFCVNVPIVPWLKNGKTKNHRMRHSGLHLPLFVSCQWHSLRRCVYYGVLSHKEAERLNQVVVERKRNARMGISTTSSPASQPKPKKKKVKVEKDEAVDDPDMMPSRGGEAVGLASL
jgi:hypothetical protein